MEKLAICAIMRNEARYVYEWLSYHYVIGVRKFFIYNHNSSDNTIETIERWPGRDLVRIAHWPYIPGQTESYHHMIATHRGAAEWCAFMDGDEFLCPQGKASVLEILDSMPSDRGGLYVQWLMFGSSGKVKYEAGLVTSRFTRRAHEDFGPNCIGKTIVRLDRARGAQNAHVIRCDGMLADERGEAVDQNGYGIHTSRSHRRIALNHYFTKSLEEWRQRRALGKVDKAPDAADFEREEKEFHQHDANDVEDLKALAIMNEARRIFY